MDARGILRVLVPGVAALTRCEGVEKSAMRELDNQCVAESVMWPTAFTLKELTAAEEARIGALVKKAVS